MDTQKKYQEVLDYCADDLTENISLEDVNAALNDWEAFCNDLRESFVKTQKSLQEQAEAVTVSDSNEY